MSFHAKRCRRFAVAVCESPIAGLVSVQRSCTMPSRARPSRSKPSARSAPPCRIRATPRKNWAIPHQQTAPSPACTRPIRRPAQSVNRSCHRTAHPPARRCHSSDTTLLPSSECDLLGNSGAALAAVRRATRRVHYAEYHVTPAAPMLGEMHHDQRRQATTDARTRRGGMRQRCGPRACIIAADGPG